MPPGVYPRKKALTDQQIQRAKDGRLNGATYKQIADQLGSNENTVRNAVLGIEAYAPSRRTVRPQRQFDMSQARKIRDAYAEGGWTVNTIAVFHDCSADHMRHLLRCSGPYVGDPYPVLGLPGTPVHTKVTDQTVKDVRRMHDEDGLPAPKIAAKLGLGTSTVYSILRSAGRFSGNDTEVLAPSSDRKGFVTVHPQRPGDGRTFASDMMIDVDVNSLMHLCQGRKMSSRYVESQLDFVVHRHVADGDVKSPQGRKLREQIVEYVTNEHKI